MKKKAIKLATSTAIAATAFVAAAPANQADAAVNVDQLVKDAETAAGALKWAISLEGTADGKTRPWAIYNLTKDATAKAKAAVAKTSGSQKVLFQARLQAADVQIDRAQAYIDALTAGEKIKGFQTELEKAISSNNLDAVETNYHNVTREIRKQATLLYRVYGQSTRDLILSNYKAPAERVVNSVKVEVTVKMELDLAAAAVKAGKYEEASKHIAEANALFNQVDQWKTELTKNRDDVVASLPLTVTSLTRVDSSTVQVTFSKAVDVAPVSHFTFDNGLSVTAVSLSADKKTATLTTTTQSAGKVYTLTYKGEKTALSFSIAAPTPNPNVTVDAKDLSRQDVATSRAYTVSFVDPKTGLPYTGHATVKLVKTDASFNATNTPAANTTMTVATAADASVGGTQNTTTWTGVVGPTGKVSFVITNTAAENVVPVVILDRNANQVKNSDDVEIKAGATAFYGVGTDIISQEVDYVNTTDKYFVVASKKYKYDANDIYQIKGVNVTQAEFETALNAKDKVTVTYKTDASGTSIFNIDTNLTNNSLTISDYPVRVTGSSYNLQGKGEPGAVVVIKKGTNLVDKVEVSAAGTWSKTVTLDKDALSTFTLNQYVKGTEDSATPVETHAGVTKVATIYQGAFNITASVSSSAQGTPMKFDATDSLTLDFTKYDDLDVDSAATVTVRDSDGTTATFTNGLHGTTFTVSDFDKTDGKTWAERLVVKLGAPTTLPSGGDNKLDGAVFITGLTGVTNQSNIVVDLTTGDVYAE